MQYLIGAVLVILSLKFQKSKIITALNIIFMWIIMAFNYNNADYNNYLRIYDNPDIISDAGFGMICRLFKNMGFSYNIMLGVIAAVCLCILYCVFRRMSDKTALITALYFLFPFSADAIQVRNFIAMTIILYALKFLDDGHSRWNMVFYVVSVLLAASFHVLALVYILLPVINKLSVKLNFLIGAGGALIMAGAFRLIGQYYPRMNEYIGRVEVWKALAYMLPFIIFFIVGLCLCNRHENMCITSETNRLIMKSTIYLFMYNMLLFTNLNYHRIFRNFLPILNVQYAELFKMRMSVKKVLLLGALVLAILIKVLWGWEERKVLLENNYLFDLFV